MCQTHDDTWGFPLGGLPTSWRDILKQITGVINDLSLDLNHLVSCSFPSLLCFLLPSLYLAPETSLKIFLWFFFSGYLNLLSLIVSLLQTPLRATFLKYCLHHSFSFSETYKCKLQPPTVNLNFSAWLLLSLIMFPQYQLSLISQTRFTSVLTDNHIALDLGCLSFHCFKFCKIQTMVGFLPCFSKLEEPSPSTFSVRSTDFANWIKMNLQRKPGRFRVMTLRHPNSRIRSCKYGESFLINSYLGTGVNSLSFVGHLVSDATTQMPVTVWRQPKIKCTQTNVAIFLKKLFIERGCGWNLAFEP